jgi:Animal haem peroxidase
LTDLVACGILVPDRDREGAMEQHGSESYFILGEGMLGEALGGRDGDIELAGTRAARAVPPFRFSRMGPKGTGKQLGEPNRRKIAQAMTPDNLTAGSMGAGFTYLGQFIDHDLTFDKTALMEGADINPATLQQGRSPTLDLDCLYGNGPQDPGSAEFYSDDRHLKVGSADGSPSQGFDLPRRTSGTAANRRKAVIPDHRNDENLAVGQTHLALIRFHNRVVDTLPSAIPPAQRFAEARKIVTKHYQWMIRTDYLPKICQPSVVNNVFANGRKAFEQNAGPMSTPTMPVEFSVAAFRLGHAMIRADYRWNLHFPDATLSDLFTFSGTSGDLGGGTRLPSVWIADWRRLYNFGVAGRNDLKVPAGQFNQAMRIDTKLVNPLRDLRIQTTAPRRNLAFRNLLRANMVKLATGQQMAAFLRGKGVQARTLTKAEIRDGRNGARLDGLTATQRDALLRDTPLWFYILREAELNQGKLMRVGARIVAETFHRAMEGSTHSIVRDTAFRPTLGPNNNTFRMVDLLLFAFEGKKALLNPNG